MCGRWNLILTCASTASNPKTSRDKPIDENSSDCSGHVQRMFHLAVWGLYLGVVCDLDTSGNCILHNNNGITHTTHQYPLIKEKIAAISPIIQDLVACVGDDACAPPYALRLGLLTNPSPRRWSFGFDIALISSKLEASLASLLSNPDSLTAARDVAPDHNCQLTPSHLFSYVRFVEVYAHLFTLSVPQSCWRRCRHNCAKFVSEYSRTFTNESANWQIRPVFWRGFCDTGIHSLTSQNCHHHEYLRSQETEGIIFHAFSYPKYNREDFPYFLGYCQVGVVSHWQWRILILQFKIQLESYLPFDSSRMRFRNYLWLSVSNSIWMLDSR